ncbi:MAG: hypothetical protein J6N52_15060 [Clostridia bacterium]|nr:hypothetical protein [Clostridia bacterium]
MLKIKKLISVLLCAASVALNVPAYARTFTDLNLYTHEINIVTELGIMDGENSLEFFPGDELDRAELVKSVMGLFGTDKGDGKQRFVDVPKDYYAFDAIDSAVCSGLIEADDSRRFMPEEKATAELACRIMLLGMNYRIYYNMSGKTAAAYAAEIGLLDGLSFGGETITRGELAKLIYNSFYCNIPKMSGSTGSNAVFETDEDKTALSFMGMRVASGTVTANDKSSLYYSGKPAGPGNAVIDDVEFFAGDSGVGNYLGYHVEAICTDTGDTDTVVCAVPSRKNKTLKVDAEDITEVTDSAFRYGAGKNVRLRTDICMVYNGIAVRYDYRLLDIKLGSVTFLSNSGSGSYGIVFINEFESFVAASVSAADSKIYLKSGGFNGKNYIDLSPDKNIRAKLFEDGSPADLSAVKPGSVISVFYASGADDTYTVYISKKKLQGRYTAFSPEDETVTVGGAEYKISENAVGYSTAEIGSTYEISLDFMGYIAEFSAVEAKDNYAVLLRAVTDTENEDICIIKYLASDGKIYFGNAGPKKITLIKGDEHSSISPSLLEKKLKAYLFSVVIIDTDSAGAVTDITLPDAYNSGDIMSNEGRFTLYKDVTSSVQASYGIIDGVGYGSSITFIVPPDEEYSDEECQVKTGGYFSAGSRYSGFKLYDVGLDGQAKAILVRSKGGSSISDYSSGLMIVEKRYFGINADDETVTVLSGYKDGQKMSVPVTNGSLTDQKHSFEYDIKNADIGDVFLFQTNSAGEISSYAFAYSDSLCKDIFKQFTSWGNGQGTTRECSVYHGYVRFVSEKYLTLQCGSDIVATDVSASALVFRVNRSDKIVSPGEWGDIIASNYNTGLTGSEVVVRTNRNGVQEVIIYED